MLKKFALYLPQFHEIEENNKWWGKGFTEWTNVKEATPLFKKHIQPKVPIDGYYNLLDKKTLEYQNELCKKYGIDGFIYYHYYFKGKKLLEKPIENLLKWKDIKQRYFFCWANHSWIRSWNGTKEILIKQEYGNINDWEEHFQYLISFFKDDRYEKKDNKPLFMIFDSNFDEKNEMFKYFNRRCCDYGFDGIFIINTCNQYNDKQLCNDYSILNYFREPICSRNYYNKRPLFFLKRIYNKIKIILSRHFKFGSLVRIYNGNNMMKCAIKKIKNKDDYIPGLFFEWDNTPRHKNRGYIITPIKKKTFMKYMNMIKNKEYVFINAWNEWAEGMMLEGTKDNKYKYLEWIKEWIDKEE